MTDHLTKTLAERDGSKPAEQQGLFRKFEVYRTDGSDAPGGKHHGCEYFVLDVNHDKHAAAALAAYADAVEATHPELAKDMRSRYGLDAAQQEAGEQALPPLLKLLADWEDQNGTMAAIMAEEWAALFEPVRKACIEQSPRMLRTAFREARAAQAAQPLPVRDALEAAARELLFALVVADDGCTNGGLGPGFENGHGEEVGTRIAKARAGLRAALTQPAPEAAKGLTTEEVTGIIHLARQRWNGDWTYTADEVVKRWAAGEFKDEHDDTPPAPEAQQAKPPKHRFWGAGEADCPPDLKAPNGELHSLRCKVCGETNPRDQFCWKATQQPAQAVPLTLGQIAVAFGWKPGFGPLDDEIAAARRVERACAEAWGVKLAGSGEGV